MRIIRLFSLLLLTLAMPAAGCGSDSSGDPRADVDPDTIDRTGSCEGVCGEQASTGCWCDSQCGGYGDCCDDYQPTCDTPPTDSCADRCGERDPAGCSCDEQCATEGDCCADYEAECASPPDPNSCVGNCDGQAPGGCWCDTACVDFGNCCDDYDAVCVNPPDPNSCQGVCGGQAPGGCWCNDGCTDAGNCCDDYDAACGVVTDPWDGLTDGALIAALQTATSETHVGLDYTAARNEMYGVNGGVGFDIIGGVIEGVYTGVTAAPDGTRTPGGILNTEHSWPQSEGADVYPRRGDMHHLFPSQQTANSQRSNLEFGETVCAGSACPWDGGGSERGLDTGGQDVFQVRQLRRGDIARAHFYFSVRYSLAIGATEEATLRTWHSQDPPDARERTRNDAIEPLQGNRNPFVDYPDLVDRIGDF